MSTSRPITKVKVKLIGEDGNAYYILGKVSKALRDAGYDEAFIDDYIAQATSGDYDTLLRTTLIFVDVE
ncbi:MAG: hypothetical protein M0Q23_01545 [Syntrophales bacterium]|nr:hypothetical protein [Syntrophales bacterium]MCK9527332.1 hypothetical protein [Syntrophales bacterium]MDX9921198.1 hypothetical protein [Syntrophales bacterium]